MLGFFCLRKNQQTPAFTHQTSDLTNELAEGHSRPRWLTCPGLPEGSQDRHELGWKRNIFTALLLLSFYFGISCETLEGRD